MIKTLPLLCVFVFNAFVQCARLENCLYYPADYAVLFPFAQVECIVLDKPDYFAPVPTENDFSAVQPLCRACGPVLSCDHAAILSRYNAFCKTVLAMQSSVCLNGRRSRCIAYVKALHFDSPEDVPLTVG
jgi:hypothetical protein